jgi:hypothetical protein
MQPDAFDQYSYQENVQESVPTFFSTLRSENTRTIARQIVEFLLKKRKEDWKDKVKKTDAWSAGWTRSSEIFSAMNNPNPFTITRLLRQLSAAEIIERKECSQIKRHPGKIPVFYRVPGNYNPLHFKSREELLTIIKEDAERKNQYSIMYLLATEIFKEHTGKDIHPIVKSRFKDCEKKIQSQIDEKVGEGFKEPDPCQSLIP